MADEQEKTIQEQLKNLGAEFNPNPGFGFMGQMEGPGLRQRPQEYAPAQAQPAPPAPPSPPSPPEAAPQVQLESKLVNDVMAPINSELQSIRTQLDSLRTQPAQPPVTQADGTTVDPVAAAINNLDQKYQNLMRTSVKERARLTLQQAKSQYPDLSEADLEETWRGNGFEHDLERANNVQWEKHWDYLGKAKKAPKVEEALRKAQERLEQLERQQSSGRGNALEDMSGVPQVRRQGDGLPQSNVMGNEGFEDQVYEEANKIMGGTKWGKGRFLGFNRALNEAARRLSLRNVV
jgi:hypothetical protein